MKRFVALLIVLAAGMETTFAADRVYKPHSKVNDPALLLQLRQEMGRLENSFWEIESHFQSGVDFDKIVKSLDEMDATRRTLQRVVSNKSWSGPLDGLSSQIQKVRKAALKQDPITLRKQVDGLYDACFRCHAANAPKYQ